ncbi:PARG [Alphabaculovirus myunipunctae]|uniref:PARG n=1 Tax=Mythimna unipuncta nucleopolyhedrovirus TaxID=447897 RepID=A0A2K9VS87_9ABAC|nr:PARG [Mythimna unipuncta nucleopolyhedrovirus]AUV65328.1 PARG [Mythimna unipuncta nucleopolyhedrovirus]
MTEENELFAQYVSLQTQLLSDTSEIVKYDDVEDSVFIFMALNDSLKKYLDTLRELKMKIVNFVHVDDRDALLRIANTDELTILDEIDLINRKLQLISSLSSSSSSLLSSSQILKSDSMLATYDVVTTMNDWADRVGILEFRDLSYRAEMEHLLSLNIYDIELTEQSIGRIECAAIIFQALIRNNSRILDFKEIVSGEQPIMIEKHKCIMYYLVCVFEMMKRRDSELDTPITIRHHVIDRKTVKITDDVQTLKPNDFVVDVFAPYRRYDTNRARRPYQYTVVYVQDKIGSRAFGVDTNYEDVWFMKCPELYAMPRFVRKVLGDDESYAFCNLKQYNVMTTYNYNTRRVQDADAYTVMPMFNFLMYQSCAYRVGTDLYEPDIDYLNREIYKLLSGVRYEQVVSSAQLEFFTSPHNCNDNRTYQFLIEVLVCAHENCRLHYCASNAEQQRELNDTMEAIQTYSVSHLYNSLVNYNFNTTGPMNFYKERQIER